MTEAEWLTCTEPDLMLGRRGDISERKLILLGCACCRRQWPLVTRDACRRAVETAERFADGLCGEQELRRAREAVAAGNATFWERGGHTHAEFAAYFAAVDDATAKQEWQPIGGHAFDDNLAAFKDDVASAIAVATFPRDCEWELAVERARRSGDWGLVDWGRFNAAIQVERAAQCEMIRGILGNPFRPVSPDRSWLTPAALQLAVTIYDDRAFERMPELANALERTGCTNQYILAHCRGPGPHVRGCWVVDLILGRT